MGWKGLECCLGRMRVLIYDPAHGRGGSEVREPEARLEQARFRIKVGGVSMVQKPSPKGNN
jgi:hypothetical protein